MFGLMHTIFLTLFALITFLLIFVVPFISDITFLLFDHSGKKTIPFMIFSISTTELIAGLCILIGGINAFVEP